MKKGNHYIYQHIREDNDTVFYIGVGTKLPRKKGFKTIKTEYQRAYNKLNRVGIWKNIVSKTSYIVEILKESDNYKDILKEEQRLIALYGRIDKKSGCLANLTDGGEGNPGRIVSEYAKSISRKTIKKARTFNKDFKEYTILDCSTGIYYSSISEATKALDKWSESHMRNMLLQRNNNKTNLKLI